jgi:GT2 family glycosyltransferase
MPPRSLSVVIPTFERPTWIKRAVRSLARQTRIPDEVIAVARDTDTPTHASIDELTKEGLPFPLRRALVSEPGFMPPVAAGLRAAEGDVIGVLDDDAEALEDSAARILAHYEASDVGAVGGRCINMQGEEVVPNVGLARRVGYIGPFGRLTGDMYKEPTFEEAVEVYFLMGGCMSYRRDVAARLEFDWELNRVVATGYEIDLCLQVRNMGLRVLFDPKVGIRHYSAPRAIVGHRVAGADTQTVRWSCYNETRILLRRLPPLRGALALARGLVFGYRSSPGALPWLLGPIAQRAGYATSLGAVAMRGRAEAVSDLIMDARPTRARRTARTR